MLGSIQKAAEGCAGYTQKGPYLHARLPIGVRRPPGKKGGLPRESRQEPGSQANGHGPIRPWDRWMEHSYRHRPGSKPQTTSHWKF